MNMLVDLVKKQAYELKKNFFEVKDKINRESRLDRILGWHDVNLVEDLVSINTSLRLLNWFNYYLSKVFDDYKPYKFEYLNYKKALGKEGLEYVSNFQNKVYEQINKLIENLSSRDDNQYQIYFIINDNSKLIARILERLVFSISIKPGKVSSYYDVKRMFKWLEEAMDWLIIDPTKSKDSKYIYYLIKRADRYMYKLFANAGEKDRNN
ncbi:MAG: hypothetical protein QXX36_03905, partial [Candidatus Rehaiarchaeum fermentans]|nr:hypothetical protein [Candidatus Rehaiarchaeum fermentans]